MNLKIYIDVKERKLVESAISTVPVAFPEFFREDSMELSIMLLESQDSVTEPLAKLDITNLTMQAAIGDDTGYLAYQGTFTKDLAAATFTGELDLNTTEMVAAFVASSNATIASTFEIELQEGGAISTVLHTDVSLSADIIRNTQIPPTSIEAPTQLATSMDGILKDSTTVDFEKTGNEIRAHLTGMTPPNDVLVAGNFLQVNSGATGFDQVSGTSGTLAVDDLTDADTTTAAPAVGDILTWDGTNWIPSTHTAATHAHGVDDLTDVDTTTAAPTDGQVLKFVASSSTWGPADDTAGTSGATDIDSLTDVDTATSAPSVGQVLKWNPVTSLWEPASESPPATISLIGDVDTSTNSPSNGEVLGWNGNDWAPQPAGGSLSISDLTDADTATSAPSAGDHLKWNGANWVPAAEQSHDIDSLTDVDTVTASPTTGQILSWDGANWVPTSAAGGGSVSSVDGVGTSGVTVTGGPVTTSGTLTVDLDDTAVVPATYGDATNSAQITVDQQGRITAAVAVAITGGGGGGGGLPAGSNTELQFNDNGSFGSSGYLTTTEGVTSGYVHGLYASAYHYQLWDTTMTTGTHNIDFSEGDLMEFVNGMTTGGLTFTHSNGAAGRKCSLLLRGGTAVFSLAFPASWVWLSPVPTVVNIGKIGRLTVEVWSNSGALQYVAAYKEEI
jgi:hypothetical protein